MPTNYVNRPLITYLAFCIGNVGLALAATGGPGSYARCYVVIIRLVENLFYQLLVDQVSMQLYRVVEWLNAMPWQMWLM